MGGDQFFNQVVRFGVSDGETDIDLIDTVGTAGLPQAIASPGFPDSPVLDMPDPPRFGMVSAYIHASREE